MDAWNHEIVNESNKYGGKGLHIILDYILIKFLRNKTFLKSWRTVELHDYTKEMEEKYSLSC